MGVNSADVHRLFLQAIISRRIVSENLARTLWIKCIEAVKSSSIPYLLFSFDFSVFDCQQYCTIAEVDQSLNIQSRNTNEDWNEFLSLISKLLDPLSLEFKHAMDENKGIRYYGIANRKDDEIAQIATDYSANEISYFKAIIEQIMLASNQSYSVSSLAALREASHLKQNMTKTQAEIVLTSFVAKGWLYKSKKGRYSLSTRAVLELQGYLKSEYAEELLECTICMEILTKGVTCSKTNCHTYLHNHCYRIYSNRKPVHCPSCREPWDRVVPIGEAAAKDGQDRRRTKRPEPDEDIDEEQEAEMSQEEAEEAQTQTQSQRKQGKSKGQGRKRKSKGRKAMSEDEESNDQGEVESSQSQDIAEAMDIDNLTVEDGRRRRR